jgi:hypothetical protein
MMLPRQCLYLYNYTPDFHESQLQPYAMDHKHNTVIYKFLITEIPTQTTHTTMRWDQNNTAELRHGTKVHPATHPSLHFTHNFTTLTYINQTTDLPPAHPSNELSSQKNY